MAQTIVGAIFIFNLIVDWLGDGRPQPNISFPKQLFGATLGVILFSWGGFYSTWGAPQILLAGITAIGLLIAFVKHGDPRPPVSFSNTVVAHAISLALLYWGGFFGV